MKQAELAVDAMKDTLRPVMDFPEHGDPDTHTQTYMGREFLAGGGGGGVLASGGGGGAIAAL